MAVIQGSVWRLDWLSNMGEICSTVAKFQEDTI